MQRLSLPSAVSVWHHIKTASKNIHTESLQMHLEDLPWEIRYHMNQHPLRTKRQLLNIGSYFDNKS